MTYQLAEKMTGWFIGKGLLKQEDYEVYVYCIDSLLAQIFFYVVLIMVAGCLQLWPETLCYYFGFIPLMKIAYDQLVMVVGHLLLLTRLCNIAI